MTDNLRLPALAGALMILLGFVAACGSSDAHPAVTLEGETAAVTEIHYCTWERSETVNPVIEEFNRTHPEIRVVVDLIPDDANSASKKLDIMALGGGELDVWPMNSQYLRMKRNMLLPIDDYLTRDGMDLDGMYGESAASVRCDGRAYGLPLQLIVPMLFYNRDMFEAAGVAEPDDSWTLQDVHDAAERLTTGEGDSKVYGYNENWFMQAGPRPGTREPAFYRANGLSAYAEEPYFRELLQFRKQMMDEGLTLPYAQILSRGTYSSVEFFNHRCAMTLGASWVVRDMKDASAFNVDFRVGCALLPRLNEETENLRQIPVTESMIGIPVTSRKADAAWTFIRWYMLNGAESIAQSGLVPAYAPGDRTTLVEAFISGTNLSVEDGERFFQTENRYLFSPLGEAATEYSDAIISEVRRYFLGEQDLDQTLHRIVQQTDVSILAERKRKEAGHEAAAP